MQSRNLSIAVSAILPSQSSASPQACVICARVALALCLLLGGVLGAQASYADTQPAERSVQSFSCGAHSHSALQIGDLANSTHETEASRESVSADARRVASLSLVAAHSSNAKNTEALQLLRQPAQLDTPQLSPSHPLNSSGPLEPTDAVALFEYAPGEALARDAAIAGELDPADLRAREAKISKFFQRKWRGPKAEFSADFELLANYYAKHPEAYALIQRLARKPVSFRYQANTFRTDIEFDSLRVYAASIVFDPQRAAVLGAGQVSAVVSAADALLHEMLHAELALAGDRSLQQSGLQLGFYPRQHEQRVIAKERALFATMSNADQIGRPLRYSHSGYLVESSCATCRR